MTFAPAAVAVVADGGPRAGLGHLGRSSAIAAALRARGLEVSAHAYGAQAPIAVDGIDWQPLGELPAAGVVVLDTYTMPEAERAALAERHVLAVFHDLGRVPPGTRLVIGMDGEEPMLAGLRYAPLRAPFWGLPVRRPREHVERVLVTTGGGAPQDAAVELARAAQAALPGAAVAIVRGPQAVFEPPAGVELIDAPPTLLAELLAADLVITAAGQTALEAAATGAATIALPLVDNQRFNAEALAAAGAARIVEPGGDVGAVATALAADRAERVALAERGQAAVDGFGALRIAFRIAALLAPPG